MKYKISTGQDHLNNVTGKDDRSDAEAELGQLETRARNHRPMFPEYEQLTPGEMKGVVIVAVLVGIALVVALWVAVKPQ